MGKFHDALAGLPVGEDGSENEFSAGLLAGYDEDVSVSSAAIDARDTIIVDQEGIISGLKAEMFDLLKKIPTEPDTASVEETNNEEESVAEVSDFFGEPEKDKE